MRGRFEGFNLSVLISFSPQILDDLPHGFLGFNRVSEDATTGAAVVIKLIGFTIDEFLKDGRPNSQESLSLFLR